LTLVAPGDPVGYLGLAASYMSQQKFRDAERSAAQATRASRIDRRTLAYAYKLRGRALIQLNKPRDAEKALRKAVEMDPTGPEGQSAAQMIALAMKLGLLPAAAEPAAKK